MAPMVPDPKRVRGFRTQGEFEIWLRANHDSETELWLKIHKKDSGLPTVTYAHALEVALCWGWIDGIRKSFDERSFLQRFTPRRAKSIWSQVNCDHIARLTTAGRMTAHGQRHVDAAKADGRWDAAYAPMRSATEATLPDDLRAAIDANPRARATIRTLGRQNLFALAFRTNSMKTPAGRARKIGVLVAMLARGETVVPEKPRGHGNGAPAVRVERHRPPLRDVQPIVWTVGHSTKGIDEFLALLDAFDIELIADVRRFPGSRRLPHFAADALAASAAEHGIAYHSVPALGGRRGPDPQSPNTTWRNSAFRAYADHIASEEFAGGLFELLMLAPGLRTVIMCAEVLWWRCHRRIIADVLTSLDVAVFDILDPTKADLHHLGPPARLVDGRLTYVPVRV